MMRKLTLSLILIIVLTSCGSSGEELEKMNIVKEVDLKRYSGTWYEIARFPHTFEKGLVGVTATHTIKPNGKIGVLNQGYKGSLDGKLKKAKATAKVPDPELKGRLKVYFVPFIGSEYLILELDQENYQYALVGNSSLNYLWILNRKPTMEQDIYDMLMEKARERGFEVSRLEKVPQKVE